FFANFADFTTRSTDLTCAPPLSSVDTGGVSSATMSQNDTLHTIQQLSHFVTNANKSITILILFFP
ncbi:MAG: hypothetical protein RRY34_08545, partial [Victivallaceae bacterium]